MRGKRGVAVPSLFCVDTLVVVWRLRKEEGWGVAGFDRGIVVGLFNIAAIELDDGACFY